MPKKIVIANSIKMIKNLINSVDGFIIGIKGLSVNLPCYFDDIEEIVNYLILNQKEVFISLNKNMHNNDLNYLKKTLIILDKLNITGIIYYDASVVNIKKELGLKLDLVWGQEHMTTNYLTSNYWYNFGAEYMLVSSDITIDEIIAINKQTKAKMLVQLFGYIPIFNSRRHLVKNYLKTFKLDSSNEDYLIEKEGKNYQIIDDDNGTEVYSNNILNGIGEYLTLATNNIEYIVLNSYGIDEEQFSKVIDLFNSVNNSNVENYVKEIDNMFNNIDRGFLYTETVYKVKSNE